MSAGSLLTLLGYGAGVAVFLLLARRRRLATEGMGLVLLAGVGGGVLGARLAQWALHAGEVAAQPLAALDPRSGGRALLGGLAGGWLAVEWAKRRIGLRRSTGDLFAPALAAGEAVGRLGCFVNGCCIGTPSRVPWAVDQHGAWRHPAQLYAAGFAAALFAVLLALGRRGLPEGALFRAYLGLYGAGRFALEFLRADRVPAGPLSLVQWLCLGLVAYAGLPLLARRPRLLEEGAKP